MVSDEAAKELYDSIVIKLRRRAWHIQYQTKKIRRNEIIPNNNSNDNIYSAAQCFSNQLVSELYIDELISSLPTEKGKFIIKQLLDGFTEQEIAYKLNISQQAVNKWKKKCFDEMKSRILSS